MSRPSMLGSSLLRDRRVLNSVASCRSFVPACSPIRSAGVRSFTELRSSIRSPVTPVRSAPSAPPAAPARLAPSVPSSWVRPVPAPALFSTKASAPLSRSFRRPSSPPRRTFLPERTQRFAERLHQESARRAQDRADRAALDAIRSAQDQQRQEQLALLKARRNLLRSTASSTVAPSSPRPSASSANATRSSAPQSTLADRSLPLRERLAQSRSRRQLTSAPLDTTTRSSVPQSTRADRSVPLRERLAQSKACRQSTTSAPLDTTTRSSVSQSTRADRSVPLRERLAQSKACRQSTTSAPSADAPRSTPSVSSPVQSRSSALSLLLDTLLRQAIIADLFTPTKTRRTATPAASPVPAQRTSTSTDGPLLKSAISINGPRQGKSAKHVRFGNVQVETVSRWIVKKDHVHKIPLGVSLCPDEVLVAQLHQSQGHPAWRVPFSGVMTHPCTQEISRSPLARSAPTPFRPIPTPIPSYCLPGWLTVAYKRGVGVAGGPRLNTRLFQVFLLHFGQLPREGARIRESVLEE